MADFSEALGIDPEILAGRITFLSARAEWHVKQLTGRGRAVPGSPAMHRACAATLRRDAGALALILGRAEHAQSEFRAAGYLRLDLGFYDGFHLLALSEAGSQAGWRIPESASAWLERSLHGGERERTDLPPFAAAASRSPRQLVSVLQASGTLDGSLKEAAGLALERLHVYGAYPLGVTQTPVERYLNLFYELGRGALAGGRRTLIAMSIQREELITAAQRDQFHWRLAHKPADLIDMDMLSLGLAALEHDETMFEQVRGIAREFGITARVPFDAARLLKSSPRGETPLRFVRS